MLHVVIVILLWLVQLTLDLRKTGKEGCDSGNENQNHILGSVPNSLIRIARVHNLKPDEDAQTPTPPRIELIDKIIATDRV